MMNLETTNTNAMKKLILSLLLLTCLNSFGQTPEFTKYSNGLIYSEFAMNQLSSVVDSLNLQFRICDFDKKFYSKKQAIAHYVKLKSGDIQGALKDLRNQMDFETFLKKYPKASVKKNILVVQFQYKNYEGIDIED